MRPALSYDELMEKFQSTWIDISSKEEIISIPEMDQDGFIEYYKCPHQIGVRELYELSGDICENANPDFSNCFLELWLHLGKIYGFNDKVSNYEISEDPIYKAEIICQIMVLDRLLQHDGFLERVDGLTLEYAIRIGTLSEYSFVWKNEQFDHDPRNVHDSMILQYDIATGLPPQLLVRFRNLQSETEEIEIMTRTVQEAYVMLYRGFSEKCWKMIDESFV